ncbi:hypothetical protein C8R44DRAFT_567196, partial [Mycena epipterygia]
GLIVTTAVAIILLVESGHKSQGLYKFVSQQPTQVQVLIQVASHLLGFIHVFTLSTITNFSTRLRLQRGSVSLTELRLWQSISSIKFVWNLPFMHTGILLSYIFLHLLPASLWAAALTPILSQSTTTGTIHVPAYPPDPANKFWNQTQNIAPVTRNKKGVFSFTPAGIIQGAILNSAASTTSITGVRTHAKNDNSLLSYSGRSYGVGASAGLENFVLDSGVAENALLYTYQELGYMTDVQCWRNESSAWGITLIFNRTLPTFPDEYLACGVLPNILYVPEFISTSGCPGVLPDYFPEWFGVLGPTDATVFALQARSQSARNMFAMAAAGPGIYSTLDKVQCEAYFIPQMFQVLVNVTTSLITVNPVANSTLDMDPSSATYGAGLGWLVQFILQQVTQFSTGGTGIDSSPLGDSFLSNIQNVALANNASINDTSVIMDGISSSLESIIDDLLLGMASAQIEIAWNNSGVVEATTTAATTVTVPAMGLGNLQYVVIIATLNFLVVVVYFLEFVRTRAWQGLPLFDYNDIASLVVAVSRDGQQISAA